jgi:hypothetical protein
VKEQLLTLYLLTEEVEPRLSARLGDGQVVTLQLCTDGSGELDHPYFLQHHDQIVAWQNLAAGAAVIRTWLSRAA